VALCLGTYGDPRGVGVFYERGTPVTCPAPLAVRLGDAAALIPQAHVNEHLAESIRTL